jgi:hypothetical protein
MVKCLRELILLEKRNGIFPLTWLVKVNPLPMCHICHRVINDKSKAYLLSTDNHEFFGCKKCVRHGNTNPETKLSLLWDDLYIDTKIHKKSVIPVSVELMI